MLQLVEWYECRLQSAPDCPAIGEILCVVLAATNDVSELCLNGERWMFSFKVVVGVTSLKYVNVQYSDSIQLLSSVESD